MDKQFYTDANVLVFDQKLHLRKQTRSILNIIGFWKIRECENLAEASQALMGRQFDLAILTMHDRRDGVSAWVNNVRQFRCGDDPFLPIILTSWDARLRLVRSVIDSGADDFLISPYSTTNLHERIDVLVSNRKPFVVTEDYFGPDRRTAQVRGEDSGTVEVPNALRARAQGRSDPTANSKLVVATMDKLRKVKIRNIARRIWAIADNLRILWDDPSLAERLDLELPQILKSGRKFHDTISAIEAVQLGSLCDAVIRVVETIRNEGPNARNLELLEQSALALRVASQLGGDSSLAVSEISSAVSGVGVQNEERAKSGVG